MIKWIIGALILLLIAIQAQLWFGDSSVSDVVHKQRELKTLDKAVKEEKKENIAAQKKIALIKRDNRWVEGKARTDLGYVRKGEKFYHS